MIIERCWLIHSGGMRGICKGIRSAVVVNRGRQFCRISISKLLMRLFRTCRIVYMAFKVGVTDITPRSWR